MTPSEKFYDVLNKYHYSGVEPLECWITDDLLELQEAIEAELESRDRQAQEEYFGAEEDTYSDPIDWENYGSYGGTDSES